MRVAVPIQLTHEERHTLERWARGRRTPARLVLRAKIVLRAAAGRRNHDIAADLGTDRECVGRWLYALPLNAWLASSGMPRAPAARPASGQPRFSGL